MIVYAKGRSKKPTKPRMDVKREVLEWAIKRSGKTFEDVAKSNKSLNHWLSGRKKPTLRQLEKFANTTHAPFGYLLLSEPPDESLLIPHFRTVQDHKYTPSLDLIETIQIISHRQDWIRDRLISLGNVPLDFVGSAKLDDPPTQTAYDMRKKLGMIGEWKSDTKGWTDALVFMRDAMENAGIYVSISGVVGGNNKRPLKVKEFRGFVLSDDYAPFVFVNGTDSKAAQMFTLAHELAHIWIGTDAVFDLHDLSPANDQIEIVCNKIAAEFLISEEELTGAWNKMTSVSEMIKSLSRRFKVSKIVVARRALDLELITKKAFDEVYAEYSSNKGKSGSGGNYYATANLRIGKRFARAVISAARNEDILYRDAYSLTGLNRVTFEKFAKQLEQEQRP